MEIPQKIKNGSSFGPSDYTSKNISYETQNNNLKEHKHPYVHCNVIYNLSRYGSSPSAHQWIKQLWGIYTMECYSAVKERKFYPL